MPPDPGSESLRASTFESAHAARAQLLQEVEEEQRCAAETWENANKELDEVLSAKAHSGETGRIQRTWRSTSGSQTFPRSVSLPGTLHTKDPASFSSSSPSANITGERYPRPSNRAMAKEARTQQMRVRAAETALYGEDHKKRRLRVKVDEVLDEVKRRQELHARQSKARKFRERRQLCGHGPDAAIGDAQGHAIGLDGLAGIPGSELGAPSPRRACLLASLTLEELDLMRRDARFYFRDVRKQASRFGLQETSTKSLKGATHETAEQAFEDIIEFFTPSLSDKRLPIAEYANKLRETLMPKGVLAKLSEAWSPRNDAGSYCTDDGISPSPSPRFVIEAPGDAAFLRSPRPIHPLERMPCMGRQPAVREPEASPTLRKVKDVYKRREQQDAKRLQERQDAIARRDSVNEFKAQAQQKEVRLNIFKQKELHKVRMLEAEDRKAMLDSTFQERLDASDEAKIRRLELAEQRRDMRVEEKRDVAVRRLEQWQCGADRAERYLRHQERRRYAVGELKFNEYMRKLWKLGIERHEAVMTHGQKNDEVKKRIQTSLMEQRALRAEAESQAIAEALDARLEAAAERRRNGPGKRRYNLLERAFGDEAVLGFDHKHHAGLEVDRRKTSWKENMKEWDRTRRTFSEPLLAVVREPVVQTETGVIDISGSLGLELEAQCEEAGMAVA